MNEYQFTAAAKKLVQRASELNVSKNGAPLDASTAQELIAASQGFRNRHAYLAALRRQQGQENLSPEIAPIESDVDENSQLVPAEEDIAEWVGLHYGKNYDAMNGLEKTDWRQRYSEYWPARLSF